MGSANALRIICSDALTAAELREWLADQASPGEVICNLGDCSHSPLCRWLKPLPLGQEGLVHVALLDAVDTLERTRHAFKSRELAELRQRLEQLLKELSACED